jgi:hypothetical protein
VEGREAPVGGLAGGSGFFVVVRVRVGFVVGAGRWGVGGRGEGGFPVVVVGGGCIRFGIVILVALVG